MADINWLQRAKDLDISIRNFIDGKYSECIGGDMLTKESPRDGSLLYKFAKGSGVEVNQAVAGAKSAFSDNRWRGLPIQSRKTILQKLADLVEKNREEFALYECLDVGKPITSALMDDVPRAIGILRSCAEGADKLLSPSGSDGSHFAFRLRKPIGVVGGIIGWNYPLSLAASKLGSALAMGNCLVLKPSEFTCLSARRLAELAIEAGVPPNVFNVIHGTGLTVGATLAHHPDIDLLTFVGSSATGKQLMVAAGQSNMKRLVLECGGKSPYIVFDDYSHNLDALASDIVATAFPNQGALCVAGTRLLLQESVKNRLLPRILEITARLVPQDPLDSKTKFGALINSLHLNKVLNYIDNGEQEGATLLYGGNRTHLNDGGYYVEPAIFDNVDPRQRIAQEEIFGPVLSVLTFKDETEAIDLANNTCFGLAAYAATENLSRAQRLAQQLNAGRITVLGTSQFPSGYVNIGAEKHRESGFGYSGGLDGLSAYTTSSTVHILT